MTIIQRISPAQRIIQTTGHVLLQTFLGSQHLITHGTGGYPCYRVLGWRGLAEIHSMAYWYHTILYWYVYMWAYLCRIWWVILRPKSKLLLPLIPSPESAIWMPPPLQLYGGTEPKFCTIGSTREVCCPCPLWNIQNLGAVPEYLRQSPTECVAAVK